MGWRYWIAEQANGVGDRGIEADNNGDNNEANPYSNPTLSNITLTGYSGSESDGMKLREGTKADIKNVLISNFKDGVEVEHATTVSNTASGELTLSDITVKDYSGDMYAIKEASSVSDSTGAAEAVRVAINGLGAGAGIDWRLGWTRDL